MPFHSKFYPDALQDSLKTLLTDGFMCDVTVVADGHEFQAHKLILSAASPYFRTMFNTDSLFIESKQDRINLHGVDGQAVSDVLNFIYSSDIQITDDNVFALMEAANLFQIHALRRYISFYLQKALGEENCMQSYVMASLYQYHEVANKAFHYIVSNLSDMVNREDFLKLPLDVILKIFSSKLLDVPNEKAAYEHIMKWVKADVEERGQHLDKLISEIELHLLTTDFLKEIKDDPLMPVNCREKIEEIINVRTSNAETVHIFRMDQRYIPRVRYKLKRSVLFAIGGESSGRASQSVECFTVGFNKWRYVVPDFNVSRNEDRNTNVLPPLRCARYYAASANDDNNIYVLGGKNSSTLLDECEVFNIETNQWKYFHKLPMKLFASGAAFLDNELYVVGGYSEEGIVNKMWKFDKMHNVWVSMPPLSSPRFYHATVAAGGYIFVLGGFGDSSRVGLRSCAKYDPGCNKWFEIPAMHEPRAKFGCAVIEEFIYVFGGTSQDTDCLKSVERFNVMKNEWLYKPSMLTPRHSFSVAVAHKDIYCLGGSDNTHFLDTVEKFSLRNRRWHCVHSMQISRLAPAAAALWIPSSPVE